MARLCHVGLHCSALHDTDAFLGFILPDEDTFSFTPVSPSPALQEERDLDHLDCLENIIEMIPPCTSANMACYKWFIWFSSCHVGSVFVSLVSARSVKAAHRLYVGSLLTLPKGELPIVFTV